MNSVGKEIMTPTEDFCLYSLFKLYGIRKKGLLLTFPIQMQELRKEIDQELHRGLLPILLITSVESRLEIHQELHRGHLLRLLIEGI